MGPSQWFMAALGTRGATRPAPPSLLTGRLQTCGQHWFHAPEGPAVLITHLGCGKPFIGQLTCDQCAQPLRGAQVSVD